MKAAALCVARQRQNARSCIVWIRAPVLFVKHVIAMQYSYTMVCCTEGHTRTHATVYHTLPLLPLPYVDDGQWNEVRRSFFFVSKPKAGFGGKRHGYRAVEVFAPHKKSRHHPPSHYYRTIAGASVYWRCHGQRYRRIAYGEKKVRSWERKQHTIVPAVWCAPHTTPHWNRKHF